MILIKIKVDILLDIRVVDIKKKNIGREESSEEGIDRERGEVEDIEEDNEEGGIEEEGKILELEEKMDEIGKCEGKIFEKERLKKKKINDEELIEEIIEKRMDEEGVRMRMIIGRIGIGKIEGMKVEIEMEM